MKGLEWVEARVPNYDVMVKFYRDALGMPIHFEEERKGFIQFRVGSSKTYLALLATKGGFSGYSGFVPTIEVSDIHAFVNEMKKRGVKFTSKIMEFEHIHLVEFSDPLGNMLQAFQFKARTK